MNCDRINYSETREVCCWYLLVRSSFGTGLAFPDLWLTVPSRSSTFFLMIPAMRSIPFPMTRFHLQFYPQSNYMIFSFYSVKKTSQFCFYWFFFNSSTFSFFFFWILDILIFSSFPFLMVFSLESNLLSFFWIEM